MDTITIATLMKLFEIKIVANKKLGRFNNFLIGLISLSFSFCHFDASSEKKATSEPEIKAENNSRTNMTRKATLRPKSMDTFSVIKSKF